MADRQKKKKKAMAPVKVEDAAVGSLPLDVVSLILLKATPATLWSSRLVCKHWYTLITSPEFVTNRRSATGGVWLVTLHHMTRNARAGTKTPVVRSPWIVIYNPLLNIQEKVSFPIDQVWPNAKTLLLYALHIQTSEQKNRLTLHARFARSASSCTWNPVGGSIRLDRSHFSSMYYCGLQGPLDVSGPGWTCEYSQSDLMAFSESCLKIFRRISDKWEFMGAMPDGMWQIMGEKHVFFVATPNYYLIWTQHAQEPEMVVLFQPVKGSWTWVDNIWHCRSHLCRWNEKPVVISCF